MHFVSVGRFMVCGGLLRLRPGFSGLLEARTAKASKGMLTTFEWHSAMGGESCGGSGG